MAAHDKLVTDADPDEYEYGPWHLGCTGAHQRLTGLADMKDCRQTFRSLQT